MSDTHFAPHNLSRRLSQGDRNALAELFTVYRDRLGQMLHFRMPVQLAGRLDIDDLLQESYLAAEKRMDAFEHSDEHGPFVWLRLVTLQTLTDQCRRHLTAQRRDAGRDVSIHARITVPGAAAASMASLLTGRWTSPSGVVMRAEAIQQLEDAIDRMDPVDREVLALRHFEMLSNKETAAVLDITAVLLIGVISATTLGYFTAKAGQRRETALRQSERKQRLSEVEQRQRAESALQVAMESLEELFAQIESHRRPGQRHEPP